MQQWTDILLLQATPLTAPLFSDSPSVAALEGIADAEQIDIIWKT